MVTDNDHGTRATTWIRRIARGVGTFVAAYWLFIGIISAIGEREPWTLESTMVASFIIALVLAVIMDAYIGLNNLPAYQPSSCSCFS